MGRALPLPSSRTRLLHRRRITRRAHRREDRPGRARHSRTRHSWDRGPFVLANLPAYKGAHGRPWSSHTSFAIDRTLLADVLRFHAVTPRPGDILPLRTGWIAAGEALSDRGRTRLASRRPEWAGLACEAATLAWLWDTGIAGVATDNPTVEAAPFDVGRADAFLRYQLIPLLGFLLGELFALDELALRCARPQRWEGLLIAAPLHQPGGVGSPANAIAFV